MFEVLGRLPWMKGAICVCWSTWLGGSTRQSEWVVQEGKYSKNGSKF